MISVDVQLDRGGFSLDVAFEAAGRVTGLFGPSGAGKTTLIHLVAGLERPDRGRIELHGQTLFDDARRVNVPPNRRRIGVVFQEHRLFPHYSVSGNLLYGTRAEPGRLPPIVDLLELGPVMGRRVAELSGGERQRIALGRALLSEPRMLLLDEPLASLDRRLRDQILPYLGRIHEVLDVPLLYVSHDLSEILRLTDDLLVLEDGRSAGHGRYVDLVHEARVLSVVHDRGMVNVLRARVLEHHAEDGVTGLALGGPPGASGGPSPMLLAPLISEPPGAEVTVAVQPWDVALAADRVADVSIQNQVPGVVKRCTTHRRRALVEVDIGAPLIVEISRRSVSAMGIEAGRKVVCLIKSHAIRCIGGADRAPASAPGRPARPASSRP